MSEPAPPPTPAAAEPAADQASPAPRGRGQFGRTVIDAILEGNSAVVTILAIGGLLFLLRRNQLTPFKLSLFVLFYAVFAVGVIRALHVQVHH